jgi:hypothetical protein
MEKDAGLAISPLADTPIRVYFPEMGDLPLKSGSSAANVSIDRL